MTDRQSDINTLTYAAPCALCPVYTYNQHTAYRLQITKCTYEKPQPIRISRKCNCHTLGEEKHIPWTSLHLLACLIGDFKLAFKNNLHLIVGVCVDEGRSLLKAVEPGTDGLVRVGFFTGYVSWFVIWDVGWNILYLERTSPRKAFSLAIRGGLNVDWACA